MNPQKTDGWAGSGTNYASQGAKDLLLWCTEAVTSGNWIAIHEGDETNPGAVNGASYRIADSDESDADDGTVGVALQTTSAAGFAMVRVQGYVAAADVADAAGDDAVLMIGTTAGQAIAYSGTDPLMRKIGLTLAAPSSNSAPVIVYAHPRFLS